MLSLKYEGFYIPVCDTDFLEGVTSEIIDQSPCAELWVHIFMTQRKRFF